MSGTSSSVSCRWARGKPFDKGIVYKLLNNRTYVGEVEHKGAAYPGQHEAIIERDTWEKVRAILAVERLKRERQPWISAFVRRLQGEL